MRAHKTLMAIAVAPLLLLATPASGKSKTMTVGQDVSTDTYTISARRGTAGVAEKGHIEVRVEARQGYELSSEQGIKVKMKGAPKNLEWGQAKLSAADGQFSKDATEFRVRVPFRAERIGDYPVKGRVKFKMCRGDECKRVSRSFDTAVVVH